MMRYLATTVNYMKMCIHKALTPVSNIPHYIRCEIDYFGDIFHVTNSYEVRKQNIELSFVSCLKRFFLKFDVKKTNVS